MSGYQPEVTTIGLPPELPPATTFALGIRRAPSRGYDLSRAETVLAVKNALRYVPADLHETLAPEFLAELREYGRIYAYRYRPQGEIVAHTLDYYQGIPEARRCSSTSTTTWTSPSPSTRTSWSPTARRARCSRIGCSTSWSPGTCGP
jgi:hypothetical protein